MSEDTPQADFSSLVTGLAASALAVLGQVETIFETGHAPGEGEKTLSEEEKQKRVTDGLNGARQLIDMLGVLERKTQGNLEADEQELLGSVLSELRIRHVTLSNRPVAGEKSG